MANCVTLSKGRRLPCRGGNGGFKAVGFLPWSEGLVSGTNGEVATLSGSIADIYRYELKNAGNTYSEAITADAEARTVLYDGTLNVVLHKLDLDTRNEIKMLAMGELVVFVETYNGDILVVGAKNGANLTAGTSETGGAKADFFGNKLTFMSQEDEPYLRLSTAAKATYATLLVEGA